SNSEVRHILSVQEVAMRIEPERIDHAISRFVRNQCSVRLNRLGSSRVALRLAGTKGAAQPGESEANPAAAWVQVPRIGVCGAGGGLCRVTRQIWSTGSLRRFRKRYSGVTRLGCPGKQHGESADLDFQYLRNCRPAPGLLFGKSGITPG